jgi:glutamyl-tRNA synthetase
MEIGRFAPSPSGRMHLGNVFSALLAWLSVKSAGGELVLRIEDLDPDRCRPAYADQLKRDLEWLGLFWDREQTRQSLRGEAYEEQFEKLRARGLVYPCYCTRDELHAASAPHGASGQPVYPGTCRRLTDAQRAAMTRLPAWRVIVPDETVSFADGLQGGYAENLARDCGDFIVRRSDGVYAYQLAAVTDDADAGVTQVVRGCDLLSSVPRQIYLQRLFGFPEPKYWHVPLLVAPDGKRLSKRERALDLGELRKTRAPEEILGRLAGLCGLRENAEPASARELLADFSWNRVKKENIVIINP